MLVRHLKSDQKCAAHCSYLELESFDKQLKRFRHKRQCAVPWLWGDEEDAGP